jgi:4-hydroxy-tetrahydrodipicolinate reductase
MSGKRYRVAQWATGHTGLRSLQRVIEHPQYELVGVYVYSNRRPDAMPATCAAPNPPA